MPWIGCFRLRARHVLLVAALGLTFYGFWQLALALSVRLEERAIEALSWLLAGKTVVVDAGHGGTDPGVVGPSGVPEKDITLAVARRLRDLLRGGGARVIMTREKDEGLGDSKRDDLEARVDLANRSEADIFVSIHANSFQEPDEDGAQTFSQPGCIESRRLSHAIQAEIVRLLRNTVRVPKEVDYFLNRQTRMPSVIVEIGFVTNPREERLLVDPTYQGQMAFAIYAGIIKYFAERAMPAGNRVNEKVMETFERGVTPRLPAP
ncbi:MAG: N-acetylmuramoyl-L-alanine amidase [Bacillota bacterium]